MDLATLLGMALGWGAVLVALMLEGGRLSSFIAPAPIVLVFGGTFGAALIGLPWKTALTIPNVMKRAFFGKPVDSLEVLELFTEFIKRARRDGILSLDGEVAKLSNEFLRAGVQLVIDGTSQDLLKELLGTELRAMRARHGMGQTIFTNLGGFAPTLGIIGTVMGLVTMLANLERPEEMGKSIASAFIATLYGISSANLIFLPISNKLKANSSEEQAAYQLAVEGILALQAGESPRVAQARMRSFLSPRAKQRLDAKEGRRDEQLVS
jgi:chemotaxis protein MotA